MKKILLILSLIPCLGTVAFAQSKADALVEDAMKLVEIKKYEQANPKLQAAGEIYKNEGNNSLYVKCVAEQGKNLLSSGRPQDAVRVLENLIHESETLVKGADENVALANKYLGSVYYESEDLVRATPYFKKALEIREKANASSPDLFRDYYNLGVMYRNLGNYAASVKNIGQAIALQNKNPNPNFLSKLYLQIGTTYAMMGDFSQSEDYLDMALEQATKVFGTDAPELAVYFMEKGNVQKDASITIDMFKKANTTLTKALTLFNKQKEVDWYNKSLCLNSLGELSLVIADDVSSKEEDIASGKKAKEFFLQSLEINKKEQPNSVSHLFSLMNLAAAYNKAEDFENANKTIAEAEKMGNKILPKKHKTISNLYAVKGDIANKQQKLDEALAAFKESMNSLLEEGETDVWQAVQNDKVISIKDVTMVLGKQALVYNKKGDYAAAFSTIELCEKVVDKMRSDYNTEGTKMVWSDFVIDAYENAIEICLALSKKDPAYKEKAYYYSEKSKGLLLLEAFQSSKAGKMAGLSDAALKEEENLRLAISDLKQQIFQYKTKGEGQSAAVKKIEKDLFDKKQAYSAYLKRMQREHPEYYGMKYDIKLLSVADTRKLLAKDQALIEYYAGNKRVFVFKITPTEFEIYDLPIKGNLSKKVKNFRESIYGYYLDAIERTDEAYEKFSDNYAKSGYELFQTLVQPLGKLPKRLIIVPAGPLANMPFEPLLEEMPKDPKMYKSHKFFVKNHIISYNYSATLLNEMVTRQHKAQRETFLAFAPSFGTEAQDGVTMRNRRFALAPLVYNTIEVDNIKKTLGTGTVFKGKEAIEEKFKALGGHYQIIHFATHGMANDRDPDFSLLAFTEIQDSVENEFIYVSDLYNMQLNADLVVLSACETGLGELRKGEGVISLARGFSYAGAKSIFTTLWSVNDQATSIIIESFYKYLKQGKPKDEALHLAKMDFLAQSDNIKAHPFLWAPYIFIGDNTPLKISSGFPWLYVAIGGGALILLGFAFVLLKKGKRESA